MKTQILSKFFLTAIMGFVIFIAGCKEDCSGVICIITPKDKEKVEQRPIIKGKVTATKVSNLFILIKPLAVSECWVQSSPTDTGAGTWVVQVHVGNPGPDDAGKYFAIQAIANPVNRLPREKEIGNCDVEAEFKTDTIIVERKEQDDN